MNHPLSTQDATRVATPPQAGTDPLGDLPLEHALYLVARGIPESEELWRTADRLESMRGSPLEVVGVEELGRRQAGFEKEIEGRNEATQQGATMIVWHITGTNDAKNTRAPKMTPQELQIANLKRERAIKEEYRAALVRIELIATKHGWRPDLGESLVEWLEGRIGGNP